ncbi:hypothetical protein [Neomoorella thermoacetica]|uniref:hypothetical protein n=1 Tax=Neomoorella thermoacetica TaxID=1525 RepID=UPI001395CFF6|nr:hypothetical protein [Moorella thermoacetica]
MPETGCARFRPPVSPPASRPAAIRAARLNVYLLSSVNVKAVSRFTALFDCPRVPADRHVIGLPPVTVAGLARRPFELSIHTAHAAFGGASPGLAGQIAALTPVGGDPAMGPGQGWRRFDSAAAALL